MVNLWLVLTLIFMAGDWTALWSNRTSINYLTKPLALLFLMVWFWSNAGPGWVTFCFLLGLFFSLIGDAFLLLPPAYFKAGLFAFLLAHLAYLVGFTIGVFPLPVPFWAGASLIGGVMFLMARRLVHAARNNPRHRAMAVPIMLYAAAISVMFLFAGWTVFRPEWNGNASALAACGALLFLFSDLVLAYDRFVKPIPRGRLIVRMTYHLGQFALAAGVILFSRPS